MGDMEWADGVEAVRFRLIELERENTRLHRLVAELLIKNQQLRAVFGGAES